MVTMTLISQKEVTINLATSFFDCAYLLVILVKLCYNEINQEKKQI